MNRRPGIPSWTFFLALLAWTQGEASSPSAPERFLLLGPLPAPAPIFGKSLEEAVLDPAALEPREGGQVPWLGENAAWQATDAPQGKATLTGKPGQVAYLATFLDNPRWQRLSFRLEGTGTASLYLDGALLARLEGGKAQVSLPCPQGTCLLLIQAGSPKDEQKWRIELSVTPEGVRRPEPPVFGLGRARRPARFEEIRLLERQGPLALAPKGDRLAVSLADEIQVRSLPENLITARAPVPAVSSLNFLGTDRLAFLAGKDLKVWNLESGAMKTLLSGLNRAGNLRWSPGGTRVFWLESPSKPAPGKVLRRTNLREGMEDWNPSSRIWSADLEQGLKRPISAAGDFHVTGFELSPDGSRLALVRKVPTPQRPWFTSEIWEMDTRTLAGRRVATLRTGFESWPADLRFSPDAGRLLFVAPPAEIPETSQPASRPALAPPEVLESHGEHNYHNADLYVLSMGDGRLERITASFDPGVVSQEGEGPWWSPEGDRIHFLAMAGRRRAFYTADLSGDTPSFRAWKSGPLVIARPAPATSAQRVAFFAGGFTRPPYPALLDPTASAPAELVDPAAEARARWHLVEPTDFAFLNRSGTRIDGWIYKPLAPPADKHPLIVYFYAGATGTKEGFNWTHQFLAANGYAVYVINPRGAGEYGREFADSHVNDWGARATQDVLEGLERVLQAHPDLDPARVGCYGGSYGGFSTLDLLTKTDRIAAAVSLFGISNIASYWGAGTWGWTYGDMALGRSYPWNRPDIFVGRSPLFNADRIQTPLLLMHGLADTNVPSVESDQMFTALQVLGRSVEYVTFAGEDHGLSGNLENRDNHRKMLLEWFDRFLKDRPEAWRDRWQENPR